MPPAGDGRPIEILLVEDNPGDVRLTIEGLRETKVRNNLHVAKDGVETLAMLRREGSYADLVRPDLILLDLNLPRKDGREVLAELKADPELRSIPVVVLTTTRAEQDVLKSYELQANCYITKPVDLEQFITVIHSIEDFWLTIVTLPQSTLIGAPREVTRMSHTLSTFTQQPWGSAGDAVGRVLVVEDNSSVRRAISLLLEDEGYLVEAAANGQEALSMVRLLHPDVIVLDLRMPVMDGWTFARACPAQPSGERLPIVIMSASDDVVRAARQLQPYGVQASLAKPFNVDTLIDTVARPACQPERC